MTSADSEVTTALKSLSGGKEKGNIHPNLQRASLQK